MPEIFAQFKNKTIDDEKAEMLVKPLVDWLTLKSKNEEITNSNASEGEKDIIYKVLNKGIVWGFTGGIASMLVIRFGPRYLAKRLFPVSNIREQLPPQPEVVKVGFSYYLGAAVDAAMGIIWGGLIWYGTTPRKYIYQQTAEIPLLAGRSHISDALCADSIRYYQESPKELWIRYGKHPDVYGWQKFIESCQKRQHFEQQLREELGYAEDQPVDIPEPGVPRETIG